MVVCGSSDAILVRTREIDDAISHALSAHKRGLALRRALQHKRHLRQYDLNLLIDEYLSAVLRMTRDVTEETDHGETSEVRAPRQLSIRRLQLAAEAMPMLLGGHVRMWEKWTEVYSRISGGLFVLREHLPVRGKLPVEFWLALVDIDLFSQFVSDLFPRPSSSCRYLRNCLVENAGRS
jgi:hypothetical protein